MAIPQSDILKMIDSLKRALATGAATVTFEGRSTTLRSFNEIQETIRLLETQAGVRSGPRSWLCAHNSGVSRREPFGS